MKKIKKVAKIEKVFGNSSKEEEIFDEKKSEILDSDESLYDDLQSNEESDIADESEKLTEKQIQKQSEIESVKSKISKILKSSNIEIIDENFGDEYELEDNDDKKQSQQDYDTLKALFGDKDRGKKDELTLTIDDFDYTYVGKYIEEFDLMHVKNIKHIRLKNPHSKKIKKALIAAGVVLVACIGAVTGFLLTKQSPVVMTSAKLSQSESTSIYYAGESFSFDGLYINVAYSNGVVKKVKLTSDHLKQIEGGSVERTKDNIQFLGGSVLMTFVYEGYELEYSVEVKNKSLVGIDVKYADGLFNLKTGEYINGVDDLIVLFNYGNYGMSKSGTFANISIKVDGIECGAYEKGKGWRLNASTKGSTIVVSYNYQSQHYECEIKQQVG